MYFDTLPIYMLERGLYSTLLRIILATYSVSIHYGLCALAVL